MKIGSTEILPVLHSFPAGSKHLTRPIAYFSVSHSHSVSTTHNRAGAKTLVWEHPKKEAFLSHQLIERDLKCQLLHRTSFQIGV